MKHACPNCGVILNVAPSRSRLCVHCGEEIVVRTIKKQKMLYSKSDAARFDMERQTAAKKSQMMRLAQILDISDLESEWSAAESALAHKWGQPPSPQDTFWKLSNDALREAQMGQNLDRMSRIYFAQARLLHAEGRPHIKLSRIGLQVGLRATLEGLADLISGDPQVTILGIDDESRPKCRADNNRRVSAALVLSDESPVPHEYDGALWCPCSVSVDLEQWKFGPPRS
jgi:hypothetical protein